MGLTNAQKAIWQRARSLGTSEQAIPLSDEMCAYLVARIARDLGLHKKFPEVSPAAIKEFYSPARISSLQIAKVPALELFERLISLDANTDTYFACLAALMKARLKYERILSAQPIPTFEQVGPRGLLQYGTVGDRALAGLLLWRKWFFDIDNRAGQETGYLFEPIIAHALGGTPAPSSKSPIRRHNDKAKGRQVDCILERRIARGGLQKRAYEIKMRVTIAASGQGRWKEETTFPIDCRMSGYVPVLVCFDGTPNPKLTELTGKFESEGGEAFIGENAWQHLDEVAGPTLARFLDLYVKKPMKRLLESVDEYPPKLTAQWSKRTMRIGVGEESLTIERNVDPTLGDTSVIPDDLLDETEP